MSHLLDAYRRRRVLDVLRRARRRIADPERWTAHAHARDALGNVVMPNSPEATCWCAVGAVKAECQDDNRLLSDTYEALAAVASPRTPIDVNDQLGYAAVLDMFDAAIARLSAPS
ncbi:MAG: hypothetical protein IT201_14575 [Thermoleophilia bacterium]|nr:hypothetical protein [Thermoleophilia bacterium]